ncbi:MAG: ParB/RepB/Spo0J family partition protein [Bacteroidetes bacterium]|uniref:ParB/RepB/Spo0J family partition protein n=1 Tax=Candidatus Merdivivens pullistercoris TaxID=2840873 RepID=A0A9D9I4N6_9BACT|nr:ParB/RepB/Spo0J family partition protein [Candidatus Merdivivens pullistercoris]
MAKKAALGKGLEALLGNELGDLKQGVRYVSDTPYGMEQVQTAEKEAGNVETPGQMISEIPVSQIEPNPFQPRKEFDEEALSELASSIKTLGLIQPITVRRINPTKFQIISGERRYRACRMAGVEKIPAYIRETDDVGMLEMAIVENLQRENLDPIEIALSFRRLIEECRLTQEEMAERVGKKRASVTNYLRLLKLSASAQYALKTGKISVGHAKVLLGIEDEAMQDRLCEETIASDLSVRQLEQKVRKTGSEEKKKQKEITELPEPYMRVLERIGKFFDNRISLKRNDSGKGMMTIHFESDKEVEKFLKVLEDNDI